MSFSWIFIPVASYIIGSIPFGLLIGKRMAGIDITQRGSGNIGATNIARELGLRWGTVTLVLDLFKGFLAVSLSLLLFPAFESGLPIVGLSALLGHQFSIFRRFQGGKGVSTALGIYLAIAPVPAVLTILIFVVTVYVSDFVSLGSMISCACMPILLLFSGESRFLVIGSIIMAALIWFKHRDNIQRILRREERKWRKQRIM